MSWHRHATERGVLLLSLALLLTGCQSQRQTRVPPSYGAVPPSGCASCGSQGMVAAPPPAGGYGPPVTVAPMAPSPTAPAQPGPAGVPSVSEFRPAVPVPQPSGARLLPPADVAAQGPITQAAAKAAMEFPPDIPQFNFVADGVATSQQPFPEGFAWLKQHGYRHVVQVKAPGEDNSAVRQAVERQGLSYAAIEVDAATLDRALVKAFAERLGDKTLRPMLVFDRRGTLAGALWFLHFRLNERLPNDVALARAQRLGWPSEFSVEDQPLKEAVERLLAASVGEELPKG